MTAWLSVLHTQLRHLRLPALLLDTIMMAVVGTLAMFVLLLGSFQNTDSLIFEAGLRYESREAVHAEAHAAATGYTITASEGAVVLAASTFDDPNRHPADSSTALQPKVWQFLSEDLTRARGLLAPNLLSGQLTTTGLLIDEASAAHLGVWVGDEIIIREWDAGSCRAKVSGVVRTYREIGTDFVSGLLVAPWTLCAQVISASSTSASELLQFDASPSGPAAQSWPARMLELLHRASDFQVSGLLPAILIIGLGLWGLTGLRASVRLRRQWELSSDLLAELGCRRRRVRAPFLLVTAFTATVAALGAAWGAHHALRSLASFYTQTLHWVSTGLLFAAVTVGIAAIVHARFDRRSPSSHQLSDPSMTRRKGDR